MEKVIERPTYITIKDRKGNTLLVRSYLETDSKVVHEENTGSIDIFNAEGERIWHSTLAETDQIEYENVEEEESKL
jgi:hypothetical protein